MKRINHFETNAILNQFKRSSHQENTSSIYATSSFVFNSAEEAQSVFAEEKEGYMYSRLSNPTNDEFVKKLAVLEGAEDGVAAASGMSAIFISMAAHLRAGDHLLASRNIFGSTHKIITQVLPRWGISHTYIDVDDPKGWKKNLMPNTRMIFIETPSNPGLDIFDLKYLGKFAADNDLYFIVDNSFATPYIQNPIEFGADLIAHSTTKFIDGQGRTIGGAVVGKSSAIAEVKNLSNQIGPTLSPFNSWILSKSLETLPLRMEKHCSNALKLAQFLENHSEVASVRYPFLSSHPGYKIAKKQMRLGGGLVSFEIKGDFKNCKNFINSLQLFSITANLGDARSSVTHPATTTHSSLTTEEQEAVGISQNLIRISVGLEHIEDIIFDVDQALKNSIK
ncbi:MAG: PLP-dependent transferase [Bacteroidales bacterium]|nr:PLP-dependent transferase [Bacteroidales bacterium]